MGNLIGHARSGKRLVLATFGSFGDFHPHIAIGVEWQRRGYSAVIAPSEKYRARVVSEGLGFAPVRPDMPKDAEEHHPIKRVMDLYDGPELLIRHVVCDHIRNSYADLLAACNRADALLSHPLTFSVPLIAKQQGIPSAYGIILPLWSEASPSKTSDAGCKPHGRQRRFGKSIEPTA